MWQNVLMCVLVKNGKCTPLLTAGSSFGQTDPYGSNPVLDVPLGFVRTMFPSALAKTLTGYLTLKSVLKCN